MKKRFLICHRSNNCTFEYRSEILVAILSVTNKLPMVIGWWFHAAVVLVRRCNENMDFLNLAHSMMRYWCLQRAN